VARRDSNYKPIITIVVCAVITVFMVLAINRMKPDYTPTELRVIEWGESHFNAWYVSAICEDDSCLVWANYHGYHSRSTSPAILLYCSSVECVPDLENSNNYERMKQ